jgi:hypothetical protein
MRHSRQEEKRDPSDKTKHQVALRLCNVAEKFMQMLCRQRGLALVSFRVCFPSIAPHSESPLPAVLPPTLSLLLATTSTPPFHIRGMSFSWALRAERQKLLEFQSCLSFSSTNFAALQQFGLKAHQYRPLLNSPNIGRSLGFKSPNNHKMYLSRLTINRRSAAQ